MANTTETVDGSLLWLRPAAASNRNASGKIAALEQSLIESARPVQTVHSVYHALLHLVRGGIADYSAAIICVDEIEHAELEFFTILAQTNSCPPVYAYGHERSLQKLGRAIELGATGKANNDLVQRLVTREVAPQPLDTLDAIESPPPTIEREPVEAAPPIENDENDHAPPTQTLIPEDAEPLDPVDDAETPVRVPWRTYDTTSRRAPLREPPPQRKPPGVSQPIAEQESPTKYDPGPLLTEEELRALIGDDDATQGDTNTDTHGT